MSNGITHGITGSDLMGTPAHLSPNPTDRQPTNTNYLNPTFFKFYIGRVPAVTYFCQAVEMPGVELTVEEQETYFTPANHPSSKPDYGDLSIRFIVDEDLSNWRQIHDWMKEISNFNNFDDHTEDHNEHCSDATLMFLTSGMNANIEVLFKNCWPVSLGGIALDSAVESMDNITSDLTLSFDSFEIRKL